MSEITHMESIGSLNEGSICVGVRFRLGFKTDWDDVTGDIDDDDLDDATLPRMNLMSLWTQDKAQLDLLLKEHQAVDKSSYTEDADIKSLLGFNKGISRSHWTPKNSKNQCNCGKKFSLKVRSHHCRRCGDLFCKACTAYRRKLNKIAHPDPNGKLYKVCRSCFDKGPQEVGQTRNLSSLYLHWREAVHHPDNYLTEDAADGRVVFTESDMAAACDRLKQAFFKDIQATGIKRTAKEIRLIVSKPKWLKYQAEDTTTNCTLCDKKFGGLVTRKHCSFCRGTVCKACSDKNVILYVPDEDKEAVQISVIKVIGCPEKEPDVCVYLRACHSCIKLLQGSQVSDHNQHYQDEEFSQIATTEEKLIKIQEQIDQGLVELQELIESFEDDSKGPPNKAILNKKQNILKDLFTDLVMTTHGMKSFTPSTKSHEIILSNIIRYRCEYYQETMQTFRDLKMKVKELTN